MSEGDDGQNRVVFAHNNAQLDGLDLTDKDVYRNIFSYSGFKPPVLKRTKFYDNQVNFAGPALNGIQFFAWLMHQSSTADRELILKSWGFVRENEKLVPMDEGTDSDGGE